MNRRLSFTVLPCFVALFVLAFSDRVVTQTADSLSTARELYSSASYEEALAILNRLRTSVRGDESPAVEQYRAFCLLALGRGEEAQKAIEALIVAAPGYRPVDAEMAPRVRSTFSDARRRLLPGIIQQKYAEAKTAFDQRDYAAADAGFAQIIHLLTDADVAAAASKPPLSDIRTLAVGFKELSAKASLPPPPPLVAPTPVQAMVVDVTVAPDVAPLPSHTYVYSAGEAGVVPPVALQQQLPPFAGRVAVRLRGVLEVVIDETGVVSAAAMREPAHAAYDKTVIEAARHWRYKAATINGHPVKFRKFVQITLEP
jgi:tetratricopeptide (TPR) repeat protein